MGSTCVALLHLWLVMVVGKSASSTRAVAPGAKLPAACFIMPAQLGMCARLSSGYTKGSPTVRCLEWVSPWEQTCSPMYVRPGLASYVAAYTWKFCGEEGANCLLKAAVVVSNPFNLEVSSKILQKKLVGREIYLRAMGGATRPPLTRGFQFC